MKRNFFFNDQDKDVSYQSLSDWYRDIKHLVWPMVIMTGILALIFLYFFFNNSHA